MVFVPAEGSTFFHSLHLFLCIRAFSDVWIAVGRSLWRRKLMNLITVDVLQEVR